MTTFIYRLVIALASLKGKAIKLIARARAWNRKRREAKARKKQTKKLVRRFGFWLDRLAERAAAQKIPFPRNEKEKLYFCFKIGVDPERVSVKKLCDAVRSERPIREFFRKKNPEF